MSDYKVINDNGYERTWEELYEDNVRFQKYTDELEQENKQLKSILVELEETIKNKIKGFKEDKDYFIDEKDMYELDNLIQKLKEEYKWKK